MADGGGTDAPGGPGHQGDLTVEGAADVGGGLGRRCAHGCTVANCRADRPRRRGSVDASPRPSHISAGIGRWTLLVLRGDVAGGMATGRMNTPAVATLVTSSRLPLDFPGRRGTARQIPRRPLSERATCAYSHRRLLRAPGGTLSCSVRTALPKWERRRTRICGHPRRSPPARTPLGRSGAAESGAGQLTGVGPEVTASSSATGAARAKNSSMAAAGTGRENRNPWP
jgi:hypothetical protein